MLSSFASVSDSAHQEVTSSAMSLKFAVVVGPLSALAAMIRDLCATLLPPSSLPLCYTSSYTLSTHPSCLNVVQLYLYLFSQSKCVLKTVRLVMVYREVLRIMITLVTTIHKRYYS